MNDVRQSRPLIPNYSYALRRVSEPGGQIIGDDLLEHKPAKQRSARCSADGPDLVRLEESPHVPGP